MALQDPINIIKTSNYSMTKIFLLLLAAFLAFTNAQPGPRTDAIGVVDVSNTTNWTCSVTYSKHGAVVSTSSLSATNYRDELPDFDWIGLDDDNIVDTITYSGACNCWIVLFDDDYFEGDSLGLWTTNSTQGTFDLTTYNFHEDADLVGDEDYRQWNRAVSSYRVFCF